MLDDQIWPPDMTLPTPVFAKSIDQISMVILKKVALLQRKENNALKICLCRLSFSEEGHRTEKSSYKYI